MMHKSAIACLSMGLLLALAGPVPAKDTPADGPKALTVAKPRRDANASPASIQDPPRGPRAGDRRDGDPRRKGPPPLTAEQEKEVLAYLKEKQPEIYSQAIADKEKDPRRYRRTLRWVWFTLERRKQMPEKIRDAYDVRQRVFRQMWRVAKQLQETTAPAARKTMQTQLRDLANQAFDAEQVIREFRLQQLEEQLNRLKEELKRRAENREATVTEDIERMKKFAERVGPEPPGSGPPPGPRGEGPPPGRDGGRRHGPRGDGRDGDGTP